MARTREEVEPEQHEVPRRPEPRSPGVWPSSVAEPGPQRSDRSLRHSLGGVGRGSGVLPALLPHSPSAGGQEEGRGGGTDEEAGGSGAIRDAHGRGSRVADLGEAGLDSGSACQVPRPHSASSTPGRRKRKKRVKKKLPRTSSFAHAARSLKSGVFSTGPLYLTVLCIFVLLWIHVHTSVYARLEFHWFST